MPLGYEQQATHCEFGESSGERIRARETHHLLSKLSLSAQQAEVIERFSRSLVDEITRRPIAEIVALSRGPSEPRATIKSFRHPS